jgi:hypothetical protein
MNGACIECDNVADAVGGYVAVPFSEELRNLLSEIFTDEFMQKYTNFENFSAFRYSGAVICDWDADTLIYSESLLDGFVRESTSFGSWNDMVATAADLKWKNQ